MKILIVSQYFYPENFEINRVALDLREAGHDLMVLTGKPNYPEGKFFEGYKGWGLQHDSFEGIPVMRIPMLPRGSGTGSWLAANYLSFALSGMLLAPVLYRKPLDAILVFEPSPITVGLPAIAARWRTGAPILFWVQDLWPESLSAAGGTRNTAVLAVARGLVRYIYRRCAIIMVQSRAFVEPIRLLGLKDADIRYLPNSTDSLYRPISPPLDAPEAAMMPAGFRVMFAGNIGAAQDFETILAAAELTRERHDIQWLIVGDGRMRSWVADQVAARGLDGTVHLLGRHPPHRMPIFFALADALLVTLKRDEIFSLTIPSKIQTYLASGRPIIAGIDGEGARVVVESGSGIACPAQSPEKLAAAVVQMSEMPLSQREAMGRAGRHYFDLEFNRQRLRERLEGWMVELLEKRAQGSPVAERS